MKIRAPSPADEGSETKNEGKNEREKDVTMAVGKEECGNAFAPSYRFDASHPNRVRRNTVAARNSEITLRDFSASMDISIYMEIVLLFSFYPLSFIYITACELAPVAIYLLSFIRASAACYHGSFYQAS